MKRLQEEAGEAGKRRRFEKKVKREDANRRRLEKEVRGGG